MPIDISEEQATAIKNRTLDYKTLFRDPSSAIGLVETSTPFHPDYDVDAVVVFRELEKSQQRHHDNQNNG